MATPGSLLVIFLLKTLKEKRRNYITNALIVLIPNLVIMVYSFSRSNYRGGGASRSTPEAPPRIFRSFSQEETTFPTGSHSQFFYAPENNLTDGIIEDVRRDLFIMPNRVTSFGTASKMEQTILGSQYFFAINFNPNSSEKHLSYTIRTKKNDFRTDEVYSRDLHWSFRKDENEYFESGFLALQLAVEKSFVKTLTGLTEDELPEAYYEHIPIPGDAGPQESSHILVVCLIKAAFVGIACTYLLLIPLVEEKASGIKELLKLATAFSHWNEVARFLINFVILMVIVMSCMGITIVALVWERTAAQMVFAFLLLTQFVICSIMFTFFISTVLDSVPIATIVSPISYFGPLVLGYVYEGFEVVLSLFPMVGFKVGAEILHNYQNSWHSFRMVDAFSTNFPGNERISLAGTMLMLTLGTLIWTFLWFYISNVRPGKYGTPKHWLFLFQKDYYRQSQNNDENSYLFVDDENPTTGVIEDGAHLDHLVKISKLNKTYETNSGTRQAVKNLSLKIYKNQITVLLGHNGAGKTTTMNIITGMTPRTSGKIEVDGLDNSHTYRQQIGFCPQHNVAMNYMTCWEHLVFFAVLRGMQQQEAKRQANEILEKVNLQDKRNEMLANLSGGMKRRFCLANAIAGRTKLLILDEPTSGLDPESRRDIWDVLLKLKKDNTVFITTHSMEEADVLGDWISIMENGELTAFGTPLYLKQHFGDGYTLKLHMKNTDFDRSVVMDTIRRHISQAVEKLAVQQIFAATLPYSAVEQYASLLKELEDKKEEYGIDSFSMSDATIEEVFINSSLGNLIADRTFNRSQLGIVEPGKNEVGDKFDFCLLKKQFDSILYKKLIHIKRNAHIYGLISALPIVSTILCFVLTYAPSQTNFDAVLLHHSNVNRALAVVVLNGKDRPIDYESLKNCSSFRSLDVVVLEDQNVEDYLLAEAKKDVMRYLDRMVAAVEFNVPDQSLKLLYNNNLLHSAGIVTNLASNLLLNYYGYAEVEISAQNVPSTRKSQLDSFTPYVFTEVISIATMLYILQYLQLPFLEASSGFRQLQNFDRYVNWIGTFVVDLFIHTLICALVCILAIMLDREHIFTIYEYAQFFLILTLYGAVALLVIYNISQCVSKMGTAVTFMSYLMIFGVCGVFLLSDGYDKIKENAALILFAHVVPEFGLKHSLRLVYENQKLNKIQELIKANSVTASHTIKQLELRYYLIIVPLLIIILTLILNEIVDDINRKEAIVEGQERAVRVVKCRKKSRKPSRSRSKSKSDPIMEKLKSDVTAEEQKVKKIDSHDPLNKGIHAITIHDLKKCYLDTSAVRGVSIAVKRGECFGLLGTNGAGKTSMFQMITRNMRITDGSVYLNEHHVTKSNLRVYRSQYGYCPQGDALLEFMTPFELINYWLTANNLNNAEELTNKWIEKLNIPAFANNQINECSGGTKRKVNTILAMLGNPDIVFLDEPTTGVDPKSKHFVWDQIKVLQQNGRTIILTSHSMDECEELCSRLTIMDDGKLRCIGFIPRLKEKHGKGFNLELKLKNVLNKQNNDLISKIRNLFEYKLMENHVGLLKFLLKPEVQLSTLFAKMNTLKSTHPEQITSFSVNETSLEDVFLKFRHPPPESVDQTNEASNV